jgi:hypothetical protein
MALPLLISVMGRHWAAPLFERDPAMRRLMIIAAFLTPLLLTGMPRPVQAADVGLSIRIGDRYRGDRLVFRERPRMVVVPGTRVYYIQASNRDGYRFGSYFYAFDDGRWYRATSYRGPWIYVRGRSVPRQIYMVPADYRRNWHGDYRYWRTRDYDRDWDRRNRDDRGRRDNRGY